MEETRAKSAAKGWLTKVVARLCQAQSQRSIEMEERGDAPLIPANAHQKSSPQSRKRVCERADVDG